MTIAIYAGSFDPLTFGHIDVIEQAIKIFDDVHILIADNPDKKYLFNETERYNMVALWRSINGYSHKTEVIVHRDLVVDYAWSLDGDIILVRGIRNVTDMISEMALADVNEEIGGVKTIFIPTSNENRNFSSSLVKELYKYNKNISKYVPSFVEEALKEKRYDKNI